MTTTKRSSDKFVVPENGSKVSDITNAIISRHPHTDIGRVLGHSRWIVDGVSIAPDDSSVLKGGEDVSIVPRMVGG